MLPPEVCVDELPPLTLAEPPVPLPVLFVSANSGTPLNSRCASVSASDGCDAADAESHCRLRVRRRRRRRRCCATCGGRCCHSRSSTARSWSAGCGRWVALHLDVNLGNRSVAIATMRPISVRAEVGADRNEALERERQRSAVVHEEPVRGEQ